MKIFSRSAIELQQEKRLRNAQRQYLDLESSVIKKEKELNSLRDEYKLFLAETEVKKIEKEKEFVECINALENEVVALETRRTAALLPIKNRQNELNKRSNDLDTISEALNAREATLKAQEDSLTQRIDAFQNRLSELSEKEIVLDKKIASIQQSILLSEQLSKDTGDKLIKFNALVHERQKELREQEKDLSDRELILKSQLNSFDERKQALDKRETQLRSDRNAVNAAIKEAKKKGIWQTKF